MVGLHVEATSRCTLACPRCERTTFIDKFGKNNFSINDLNIDDFKNFIDDEVDHINFCGNLGDPIYHKNFLTLVEVSKRLCKSVSITTNASRKNKTWWYKLVSILDDNDKIDFSIDGTPDNFIKYRINGDWDSIKTGIDICVKSKVKTTWKYIPFSFNENDIEEAKSLSKKLGIDNFKLDPSDRYEIDDYLRPKANYIGPKDEVQQTYMTSNVKNFEIDPECADNKSHYISADGFYAPCCYTKNYSFWYKSEWWKNKLTIKDNSLTECIRRFNNFYATIQDSKPDYCVFNCGKC
tara:strand:+ start:7035 stop:7916 length:882 start_codon:yes stop_codon:yes gene_type:complete